MTSKSISYGSNFEDCDQEKFIYVIAYLFLNNCKNGVENEHIVEYYNRYQNYCFNYICKRNMFYNNNRGTYEELIKKNNISSFLIEGESEETFNKKSDSEKSKKIIETLEKLYTNISKALDNPTFDGVKSANGRHRLQSSFKLFFLKVHLVSFFLFHSCFHEPTTGDKFNYKNEKHLEFFNTKIYEKIKDFVPHNTRNKLKCRENCKEIARNSKSVHHLIMKDDIVGELIVNVLTDNFETNFVIRGSDGVITFDYKMLEEVSSKGTNDLFKGISSIEQFCEKINNYSFPINTKYIEEAFTSSIRHYFVFNKYAKDPDSFFMDLSKKKTLEEYFDEKKNDDCYTYITNNISQIRIKNLYLLVTYTHVKTINYIINSFKNDLEFLIKILRSKSELLQTNSNFKNVVMNSIISLHVLLHKNICLNLSLRLNDDFKYQRDMEVKKMYLKYFFAMLEIFRKIQQEFFNKDDQFYLKLAAHSRQYIDEQPMDYRLKKKEDRVIYNKHLFNGLFDDAQTSQSKFYTLTEYFMYKQKGCFIDVKNKYKEIIPNEDDLIDFICEYTSVTMFSTCDYHFKWLNYSTTILINNNLAAKDYEKYKHPYEGFFDPLTNEEYFNKLNSNSKSISKLVCCINIDTTQPEVKVIPRITEEEC